MIGLDISDQSVKLVQLSNDSPRRLLSHCWQAVPEGLIEGGVVREVKQLTEILHKAFEHCRLAPVANDIVVASIPETQSFLRVIEVPEMVEDEIDEAVQWEVAQHIPFGLENVYIDWQPVASGHKPAAGRREVLVGAVQRNVVDPLLKTLMSMNLNLGALELESQALVRALISPELRSHQGLLIVDIGGTATNVVIHDHGAMRFTASLQHGSNKLTAELSVEDRTLLAVPHQNELEEEMEDRVAKVMRPAQEELVMEIRGVVAFYNGIDAQHEVKEILLTGGGSNFTGLDQVLVQYFDNVHVQHGNPWANILPPGKGKRSALTLRESVHFSTALGLALRALKY